MHYIYKILISQHLAKACTGTSSFFSFPTWYQFLPRTGADCTPSLTSLSDVWLIVAAVIEILLRLAGIIAFGMIVYAGISYSVSQGNPEKTSRALSTLISAAAGLAICILAAVIVTFIAGSFN